MMSRHCSTITHLSLLVLILTSLLLQQADAQKPSESSTSDGVDDELEGSKVSPSMAIIVIMNARVRGCLNEFEDKETLRLLPVCDHVFHPECIDACFRVVITVTPYPPKGRVPRSHSTGHSLVRVVRASEDRERFTLRLPDDVDYKNSVRDGDAYVGSKRFLGTVVTPLEGLPRLPV
ncbi:E3 ubiquitin-protein ligase ATL31 [Bienertia sinuspersici]